MKRIRNVSAWISVACLLGHCAQAGNTAAINEVLKLKSAGMADSTIVSFVQSKSVNYELSADDLVKLRDQGLSSAVLEAMLASSGAAANTAAPQVTAPTVAPSVTQTQQVIYAPQATAQPTVVTPTVVSQAVVNPDVAYFYQELSPYGRWILVEDGRWCWQPTIIAGSPDWRPYWDKGRWVWTDHGWYWTSDYPWGWAAFHYGRWHLHPHHGWIWFPDRVWGPAWVVWREGGDYCGWAPLPPGAVYDTTGAYFSFRGRRVEAGFDFGLGLTHFSFCFTKDMGEPMHRHFREPERVDVFRRTTVVNHYTVNRVVVGGEPRREVFNHGIEPSRVNSAKGRPVEQMKVQELKAPSPGRTPEHLDNRNKTIGVYRPQFGGPGGAGGSSPGGPGGPSGHGGH